ncbi:MAG: peptidylprolyl isomerase [Pyrinomonadaceae bacterium]|nr:peptidylprolyl isomerase [Pyrinomonadaceae bacterium]
MNNEENGEINNSEEFETGINETAETPAPETVSTFGTEGKSASVTSKPAGMSSMAKGLIVVAIVFLVGAGLVVWKAKFGHSGDAALNKITAEEMEILLKDANPMMLKRLADDPELRKQQAENLQQLLAVASQARKEGFDQDPAVKVELENMRSEVLAVNYDQTINKDKGPMPPFGFIGEDRVKEFWASGSHEAEFQKFLDAKIKLMKENNPSMQDREPSEEEIQQAKDYFAKVRIYEEEAKQKLASGELGEDFQRKVALQTKLQQAQLLARMYAQKVLSKKAEVTDAEIDKYIAEHPELSPETKKKQAEEILARAKGGEDFAKLADEFSQDPGNNGADGKKNGGLYANVTKGKMMPEFEAAALALEPGKVADNLVETPYGFHIIKLERKGETKDQNGQVSESYDVRHILISTTVKDEENPMGRELPVREMVRAKLEAEREKKTLDDILANNPVEVAVDYKIPEVSEEDLKKIMEKQMQQQMPEGAAPPAEVQPKPDAKEKPKTEKKK